MFENLSPREKKLSMIAGALVPVVVVAFGFLWLNSALSGYDEQISVLNSQITRAKTLQHKYTAAQRRLKAYQSLSLASETQQAVAEYRNWLISTTDRVFGKNVATHEAPELIKATSKFRDPSRPTAAARQIYHGWGVTINVANTTLDALNRFLYDFYRAPILHRIRALSIAPVTGSPGGNLANLPTGKIGVTLDIEAIAIAEADANKTIPVDQVVQMTHDLEWYQQQIEHRNMFGLPNNAPQITSGNQSEYEGREIAFNISARDEDPNDRLTFELMETNVPGGTLNQRDPEGKAAQFTAAAAPPGDYRLRVRVTDSGLPNKIHEKELELVIKEREPEPEPEPTPPFYHARETQVTGIVRESDGIDRVWIHIKTLDERHKLAAGESFKVDGKTWTVKSIDRRTVTLESEGEERTLKVGDKLGDKSVPNDLQ